MNEHLIARAAELLFELRISGCHCSERTDLFPAYLCTRHRLLYELPEMTIPEHLLQIAYRDPR